MSRKKVLIIEDEAEIATILEDILVLNDVEAIIAKNGSFALDALDKSSVHLIISDLNLPDINGVELYKEIIRKYPSLQNRFLFMSGYSMDAEMETFLFKTENRYIQKPFPIMEMQQLIKDCLNYN
jgi:two-component system chemotaxis response regulator CheY